MQLQWTLLVSVDLDIGEGDTHLGAPLEILIINGGSPTDAKVSDTTLSNSPKWCRDPTHDAVNQQSLVLRGTQDIKGISG